MTDFRDIKPVGAGRNGVFHMELPQIPEVRFDWHEGSKDLYVVHFAIAEVAEKIASRVQSPEAAQMLVLMWCKGWMTRQNRIGKATILKR